MKLPRTIRFDHSDDHVFDVAAAADEWAVSGAFAFAGAAALVLRGKAKQAFSNGFLGLSSFGRASIVAVADIKPDELAVLETRLAAHFVEAYGAPDIEMARPAAREELAFAADLCVDHPINTLIAVHREREDDGAIHEQFRTVSAPGKAAHARIWDVVDEDDT